MTTGFTLFDTPIGTCSLVWAGETVVGLRLPEASPAATRARIKRRWPDATEQTAPAAMQAIIDRVLTLLGGERVDLRERRISCLEVPDGFLRIKAELSHCADRTTGRPRAPPRPRSRGCGA